MNNKKLKIRPYARLLTMLGEQLIKNERIALVELIKNAYDADAAWVQIRFENFADDFSINENSRIIIEDNGDGMTPDTIEKAWMNPATPNKFLKKKEDNKTARKQRIIQGEKGIGRFAVLKLGSQIKIITRHINENFFESVLDYDMSRFNNDFTKESGEDKELFLEDLEFDYQTRDPEKIVEKETLIKHKKTNRKPFGTIIEINNLRGKWSKATIDKFYQDVSKLESPFNKIAENVTQENDFAIDILINNKSYSGEENLIEDLKELLNYNAPLIIKNGLFDNDKNEYRFELNENNYKISFDDSRIRGIMSCKNKFGPNKKKNIEMRYPECGSFRFTFYIFDLSAKKNTRFHLDRKDKNKIKDHRIYLYRDGIRVYPYGDKEDDWLGIDTKRGTGRAGDYFSNDQVIGWVEISQKENQDLKDKTSREGLIEIGNATSDFIEVILTFFSYLKQYPYNQYKESIKDKRVQEIIRTEAIQQKFKSLKERLSEAGDNKAQKDLTQLEKDYNTEKQYFAQRAAITEELAGVGLSVETASHDIMSIMGKAMKTMDDLMLAGLDDDIDIKYVIEEIQKLKGMMSFINNQLKDIQLLFRSSKQRRRNIQVNDMLDKVIRIYKRLLKKEQIELVVNKTSSMLAAKITEAVLLQMLINLFDNAAYWLSTVDKNDKQILITMDGVNGQMIFSDNGPGVHEDIAPYIFEAFVSGKGEEGRGLGLYIARQLLERNDYSIELADRKIDRKLPGANFVVSFVAEEK